MMEMGLGPLTPLDGGISLGNQVLDGNLLMHTLNGVMRKHYMETRSHKDWNLYLAPQYRSRMTRLLLPPAYAYPRQEPPELGFNPTVLIGAFHLDFGTVKVFTELWMTYDKRERIILETLPDWPLRPFRLEIIEFLWDAPRPSSVSPPKDPVPSVPSPLPEVLPQTGTGTSY